MKITYLAHSGFTVETDTKILIFDYYQDAAGIVDAYDMGDKPLWFFVSHWHGDHFNGHIADFHHAQQYIVNKDVPLRQVPAEKLHCLQVYEQLTLGDTTIQQFGSTDEGGSFLIHTDGHTLFHAGDLNWWHWLGDTDANNADAKRMFDSEMEKLDNQQVDIAFFPVDARLETAREWGVTAFLKHVTVSKCLVPMHYFGDPWKPSAAFQSQYPQVPCWIPGKSGDSVTIGL